MKTSSMSFDEVIHVEGLRQAQAPLVEIAKELDVPDVSGQYDFRPIFQDRSGEFSTESATLRLGEDGIVIVISSIILRGHFNPFQMAVYASDEIQAAGLRAELWAWIRYASKQLHNHSEQFIRNGQLLVKWYKSLRQADSKTADRLMMISHLAGLVTKYYHPETLSEKRSDILHELQDLGNRGVDEANTVFELLTSPSNEIKQENELQKDHEIADGVATRQILQLIEESYEAETEFFISPETSVSKSHYEVSRLIQDAKLSGKPIKIVFAGKLEELSSIYSLYMLLLHQLTDLGIQDVQLDTGVSDTTFYIDNTQRYVKALKRWFDNARQEIHGLAYLVRCAARNDFDNFEIKRDVRYFLPTKEELVLFYLRMFSPKWNNKFLTLVDNKRRDSLRSYIDLRNKMMRLIPKDWIVAMDAYEGFTTFIKKTRPNFAGIIDALQPINLITDNQIAHANILLTASRGSGTELIRRFPGGAANKVVFFNGIDPKAFNFNDSIILSPYRPHKFFIDADWDSRKEKLITNVLLKYILPMLRREVSVNKIKAIKLVELKRASKEAIDAVKQYTMHLQRLSLNRNDQALIDGLIFFLAVKNDIDPHTDEWKHLLRRYEGNREDLQDAVFESKGRSLPNFSAIKFLEHYLGPKGYVDRGFPLVYQKHNDSLLDLLTKSLRIRVTSRTREQRVASFVKSGKGVDQVS